MPIRGLESFLSERRLVNTGPLSIIRSQRIGVEGYQWLRRMSPNESFQVAMGGTPLSMLLPIQLDLSRFAEAGIKPLFVFNGLNLVRKDKPFNRTDGRAQKVNSAWEVFYKGQTDNAAYMFQDAEKHISLPFVNNIFKYFKEHDVEYFRAPYLAYAQLAWFAHPKQNIINATLGGLELLLFGVSRLILQIDFEKGTFDWVDQKAVLRDLNMSADQFMDACILAGFDYCTTFPALLEQQHFTFRYACEMVKNFKTGYAAIQHFGSNPTVQKLNYMDLFLRTRCMIRHHPILPLSCACEPLHKEACPSDLHDVIGPRFPNELYFILSQGVVHPQVLNNLVSGLLMEAPPMVDTEEYRRMLSELMDLRSKTLGVLTSCLHEVFQQKRVVTIRWYDANVELDMYQAQGIPELRDLRGLRVPQSEITTEMQRLKHPLNLSFVIMVQSQKAQGGPLIKALESLNDQETPDTLSTLDEMLYVTLMQGLVLRDYLTTDRQLTVLGKALEGASSKFQEECFLFLELIKSGYITSNRLNTILSKAYTGCESHEREKEILLLTRVMGLVPMKLAQAAWTGTLDHDLMGFHEIVKALYRSLRNMLEMICVALFLRHKGMLPPADYVRLSFRMPFFQQCNTATGIVLKAFLLEGLTPAQLAPRFPQYIAGDLLNAYEFWQEVMRMVTFLKDYNNTLPAEVFQEFQSANKLLMAQRHLLSK